MGVTVEIDGIGKVEFDDGFRELTPEQQQAKVNWTAQQIRASQQPAQPGAAPAQPTSQATGPGAAQAADNSLRRGFLNLASAALSAGAEAYDQRRDYAETANVPPQEEWGLGDHLLSWFPGSPQFAAATSRDMEARVGPNAPEQMAAAAQEANRRRENYPMTQGAQETVEELTRADGWGDVGRTLVQRPLGALSAGGQLVLEQAPTFAAAAVSRRPSLVFAGSNYFQERHGQLVQEANTAGYDLSDPQQAEAALADNEFMAAQASKGRTRGAIISAIDALAMGYASKAMPTLGSFGRQTAAQTAAGGGGEALAGLATEGKINPGEVTLEALAEMAGTAPDVVIMTRRFAEARASRGQNPNPTVEEVAQDAEQGDPMAAQYLSSLGIDPETVSSIMQDRTAEALRRRREEEAARQGYGTPRDPEEARAEQDAIESGEMDPAAAPSFNRPRTPELPEQINVPPRTNERPSRVGIDAPDLGTDPGLAGAVAIQSAEDTIQQERLRRARNLFERGYTPEPVPETQRELDYRNREGERIAQGREQAEARRAARERVGEVPPERENTRRENMKAEAEGTFALAERRRQRFEDTATPDQAPTSQDPRPAGRPEGVGDQPVTLLKTPEGQQPVQVAAELDDGSVIVVPMKTATTGRPTRVDGVLQENDRLSLVLDEEADPMRIPADAVGSVLSEGRWSPERRQAQEFQQAQQPRTRTSPEDVRPRNPGVGRGGQAGGDVATRQVRAPRPPESEIVDEGGPTVRPDRPRPEPEDAEYADMGRSEGLLPDQTGENALPDPNDPFRPDNPAQIEDRRPRPPRRETTDGDQPISQPGREELRGLPAPEADAAPEADPAPEADEVAEAAPDAEQEVTPKPVGKPKTWENGAQTQRVRTPEGNSETVVTLPSGQEVSIARMSADEAMGLGGWHKLNVEREGRDPWDVPQTWIGNNLSDAVDTLVREDNAAPDAGQDAAPEVDELGNPTMEALERRKAEREARGETTAKPEESQAAAAMRKSRAATPRSREEQVKEAAENLVREVQEGDPNHPIHRQNEKPGKFDTTARAKDAREAFNRDMDELANFLEAEQERRGVSDEEMPPVDYTLYRMPGKTRYSIPGGAQGVRDFKARMGKGTPLGGGPDSSKKAPITVEQFLMDQIGSVDDPTEGTRKPRRSDVTDEMVRDLGEQLGRPDLTRNTKLDFPNDPRGRKDHRTKKPTPTSRFNPSQMVTAAGEMAKDAATGNPVGNGVADAAARAERASKQNGGEADETASLSPEDQAKLRDKFDDPGGMVNYSNPVFDPRAWRALGQMMLSGVRALRNKLKGTTALTAPKQLVAKMSKPKDTSTSQKFRDGLLSIAANTMDGRLRAHAKGLNSPTLNWILDATWTRPGKKTSRAGSTVEEAQTRQINRLTARLDKLISGLTDDQKANVVRALRGERGVKLTDEAELTAYRGLRRMFKEQLDYMREAGVDVGEVPRNYFPREFDVDAVSQDPDTFKANARRLYEQQGLSRQDAEAKAAALASSIIMGGESLDFANDATGVSFFQDRKFSERADQPVENGGLAEFMVNDLDYSMLRYITRAARRAEIARVYGDKFSNKAEFDKKMRDEGVPDSVRALLWQHVRQQAGLIDPGKESFHRALSWGHALTTMSLLEYATITSLPEIITPALRSGSVREVVAELGAAIPNFVRYFSGIGPSKRMTAAYELAEFVGSIAGDSALSFNISRFHGSDQVNRRQARMLGGYFRMIQLQQFTEYTRARATAIGSRYLSKMARALSGKSMLIPNGEAEVALSELGVPEEKQAEFAEFVEGLEGEVPAPHELTGEMGELFQSALMRFTDQSVMRPTPATKPGWATTPVGRVIFALQAFGYAFTKNVLYRQMNQMGKAAQKAKNGEIVDAALYAAPVAMLAATLPIFQYAVGELRDLVDEELSGSEPRPKTEGAKIERAVSRAGFFGATDPYIQAISGTRYNRSPWDTMLGPVAGMFGQAAGDVMKLAMSNSPDTFSSERSALDSSMDITEGVVNGLFARIPYTGIGLGLSLALRYKRDDVLDGVAPVAKTKGNFRPQESLAERAYDTVTGQPQEPVRLTLEQAREISESKAAVARRKWGF